MFITSREKVIIDLIVKTSGKHNVHSLSEFLQVSVRTVQRDLKSIEKLLEPFSLKLKRNANDGLFIDGKNEQIYKLIQTLAKLHPTDLTPDQRKLRLLIILLHEEFSFKQQMLASQLGVSGVTLSSYLDDIEEWLSKYSITLTRKRGVGVEIAGNEMNKRHALANYFLVYFYEDLIEGLYLLNSESTNNEKIVGYFSKQFLIVIDQLVNQNIQQGKSRLADRDFIGLVIYICLTLQRIEQNFFIEEKLPNEDEHTSEFQLMKNICNELEKQFSIHLKYQDIAFLTVILRSSKVQAADSIDYDTVLLGKNIKKVIADVSSRLQVHLTDDFSLYQGLLAHMGPSIYRLKQKLDLFNPLTAEIKRKYPVLFIAVKKSLEEVFEDILFPEDEIAFIVLHFGSSLLKNEEKVKMNAVVVCPTGIGASKMVASRLKKELSEINDVEIMSIKDFQTANLTEYDLVISTVRLPFAEVDYILVSPLLSDKDIGFIRGYLDKHLEQISQKKEYLNNVQNRNEKATNKHNVLKNMLTEIKDVQLSMESILTNFKVYRKQGSSNCWDVLGEMINDAKKDGLVTDTKKVIEQLERREKQGGFGIPNTNMGLYHCREDHVLELIFQVAHLDRPSVIKGMDGQPMQVKSVLLMLAPEIMSKRKKEILSLISSSLVESDIAMMVFSSSNEMMIREKLEEVFIDYLQNNLIKE